MIFKRFIGIIILSIFIFTGCSNDTSFPADNSTAHDSKITESYNQKRGEEFILSLVGYDEAYISRHYKGYEGHKGTDIVSPEGKYIYAAADGTVSRTVKMNMGYGIHCIIDHGDYKTLYAHCSELLVEEGAEVSQGQIIGKVGNTGNSTGPHLHFEVYTETNGERINYDPVKWF